MKVTETTVPLTEEDLKELSVTRNTIRKGFYWIFSFAVLCTGVFTFVWPMIWLAVMFTIFGLLMVLILSYSEKKFRKDTAENIKYIVTGPVSPRIAVSGGIVEATIDRPNQRLKTKVTKGATEKEYDEPFVLGAGQNERYFYLLAIGDRKIMVDRVVFLDFQQGENAHLELSPAGTLIRYKKIR